MNRPGPPAEQLTEITGSGLWVHTNGSAGGRLIGTFDGRGVNGGLHFHIDDPFCAGDWSTQAVSRKQARLWPHPSRANYL
jgi:hypothetical protein